MKNGDIQSHQRKSSKFFFSNTLLKSAGSQLLRPCWHWHAPVQNSQKLDRLIVQNSRFWTVWCADFSNYLDAKVVNDLCADCPETRTVSSPLLWWVTLYFALGNAFSVFLSYPYRCRRIANQPWDIAAVISQNSNISLLISFSCALLILSHLWCASCCLSFHHHLLSALQLLKARSQENIDIWYFFSPYHINLSTIFSSYD